MASSRQRPLFWWDAMHTEHDGGCPLLVITLMHNTPRCVKINRWKSMGSHTARAQATNVCFRYRRHCVCFDARLCVIKPVYICKLYQRPFAHYKAWKYDVVLADRTPLDSVSALNMICVFLSWRLSGWLAWLTDKGVSSHSLVLYRSSRSRVRPASAASSQGQLKIVAMACKATAAEHKSPAGRAFELSYKLAPGIGTALHGTGYMMLLYNVLGRS